MTSVWKVAGDLQYLELIFSGSVMDGKHFCQLNGDKQDPHLS